MNTSILISVERPNFLKFIIINLNSKKIVLISLNIALERQSVFKKPCGYTRILIIEKITNSMITG